MALVHQFIAEHLPVKRKQTPRGWIVFNSPCCEHFGHKPDKRSRGNLLMLPDGTVGFNCYNCGFKTRFNGQHLSDNFESLLHWLHIPQENVNQVKLEILKNQLDGIDKPNEYTAPTVFRNFKEIALPANALPIQSVLLWDDIPTEFATVIEYLYSRGNSIAEAYDYHWSPDTKHDMHHRIIIPFYYKGNVVGWTGRYAGTAPPGTPRYWNSEVPQGYLFNCDALEKPNRKYAVLTEGPFDAIALDGVGALGSELSREQLAWLNESGKEIIVAPDRQRKNQGLIDAALEHGWSVAFPEWEDDVKDAADAAKRYGRLYTLRSVIESRTDSKLQIGIKRKMFRR